MDQRSNFMDIDAEEKEERYANKKIERRVERYKENNENKWGRPLFK